MVISFEGIQSINQWRFYWMVSQRDFVLKNTFNIGHVEIPFMSVKMKVNHS